MLGEGARLNQSGTDMLKPAYAYWEGDHGLGFTEEREQGMKGIGNKSNTK